MLDNSFGPWTELYQDGVEKTWGQAISTDDKYFRFRARKPTNLGLSKSANRILRSRYAKFLWFRFGIKAQISSTSANQNELEVSLPELWSNITPKTLSAMSYCIENFDWDYLVRGNSTLYLKPTKLKEFLERERFEYCGPLDKKGNFIAGWGIILSRRAVQALLTEVKAYDYRFYDDEAIGRILARAGIFPKELDYLTIDSITSKNATLENLQKHFMFRAKNNLEGERVTVEVLRYIHCKLDFE